MTVAPFASTYTARIPYLTSAEFTNDATGVNVDKLIPRGDAASNAAVLAQKIARASNWADVICRQVLAATVETENGEIRPDRWGRWILHPAQFPVLELKTFTIATTLGGAQVTVNASTAWVEKGRVLVPTAAALSSSVGPLQLGTASPARSAYGVWTYVAGWPNTLLADAIPAAGATTFTVTDATGVYPGTHLTIYDGANSELVTVASVTGATVTPTAALANPHTAGASVSALPPAVKQAVALLTSALIKVRGAEAIVMANVRGEPAKQALSEAGAMEDLVVAEDLLAPFAREF